jgi:putative oxygen-independent coproporphyrinogen III oxidase
MDSSYNLEPRALEASSRAPLGVYVHFPWCLRKCPYCDFVSFEAKRDAIDHGGYADAVLGELAARADAFAGRRLETVFFGGGTPSLWEPAELGRVLEAIAAAAAERAADVEVTVECNPSSLDAERAAALRGVGVNRLSVGVQGLDGGRLEHLGRLHDAGGAFAAVKAAIAEVPRVSADLIYGVATAAGVQAPAEAAGEAQAVAETGVGHVSAYALTIEARTRFGELARQGRLPLADDGVVAESFLAVGDALARLGFRRYEISNFARPGEEARHNLGYWRGHDYLGLGCGAVGTISRGDGSARRYRNSANVDRYLERARAADFAPHEEEELDGETRLRERIMLGLRLDEGVDVAAAAVELGVDPWPAERRRAAERLSATGRLVEEDGRLRVPASAWTFADGIAAELF